MANDSLYPTPPIAEVKAGLALTASNQIWAPLAQSARALMPSNQMLTLAGPACDEDG